MFFKIFLLYILAYNLFIFPSPNWRVCFGLELQDGLGLKITVACYCYNVIFLQSYLQRSFRLESLIIVTHKQHGAKHPKKCFLEWQWVGFYLATMGWKLERLGERGCWLFRLKCERRQNCEKGQRYSCLAFLKAQKNRGFPKPKRTYIKNVRCNIGFAFDVIYWWWCWIRDQSLSQRKKGRVILVIMFTYI